MRKKWLVCSIVLLFFGTFMIYKSISQLILYRCWTFEAFAQIDDWAYSCDYTTYSNLIISCIVLLAGIFAMIKSNSK